MAKALYIAEKPSVAQEFARALKISGRRADGYIDLVCRTPGDHELPGGV